MPRGALPGGAPSGKLPSMTGHLSAVDLARRIDQTLLRPGASEADFRTFLEEARAWPFASVCVPPSRVAMAAEAVRGRPTKVCTVAGFPLGYSTTRTKAAEAEEAARDGAAEVDMVMNVSALVSGDAGYVEADIRAVVEAAKGAGAEAVKVIIEACYLDDDGKRAAVGAAARAGADFVKTSTGFGPGGATAADVRLMKETASEMPGGGPLVKAAGGIRDLETALAMIDAGADRLGTSSGPAILEELARKGG